MPFVRTSNINSLSVILSSLSGKVRIQTRPSLSGMAFSFPAPKALVLSEGVEPSPVRLRVCYAAGNTWRAIGAPAE